MTINVLNLKHLYRILLIIIGLLYNTHSQAVTISTEVQNAIAIDGEAMVIISLHNPTKKTRTINKEHDSAIWFAQEYVLETLPAGSFESIYRYEHVPALTGRITPAALVVLASHPQVASVQLDVPDTLDLAQSVPWIKANQVHVLTPTAFTGQGVTVAVLDTGIDTDHLDLADDIIGQRCFLTASVADSGSGCPTTTCSAPLNTVQESCNAEDDHGHGTHVTGIVTSKGTIAPIGVAKNADVIAIKICNSGGDCYPSDAIAALDWLATQTLDIINISLGGDAFTDVTTCENDIPAYTAAINLLFNKGITIFSSTGNDSYTNKIKRPACFSNTIAVGASRDTSDTIPPFSNSNNLVDVIAPGETITSSWKGNTSFETSGTSQATPTAAGVAALMLEANPTLTPSCIRTILKNTGVTVTDTRNWLTFPRVDALAAVKSVLQVPQFSLVSLASYTIAENVTTAVITVTRSDSTGAVSADYTTITGTATAGSDYTTTSGTLNWLDGETDKTFVVSILDDNLIEGDETVTLNLSSNPCTLSSNSATLTITDYEEGTLQFSTDNYTVNENDGTLTVEVNRSGGSDGAVSVGYATNDASAVNGSDYTATNGTLSWNNGETGTKTFTITIIDDTNFEVDKTFSLELSNPTNGATLSALSSATVTIIDDDNPGTLQFTQNSYSVTESGGTVSIELSRTNGSRGTVSVTYNITVNADSHYTATNGILTWDDNDLSNKSFTLAIIDDNLSKGTETITLTLTNPTGNATLGTPNSVHLTILDNDRRSTPVISPTPPSFTLITYIGGNGNGYVETQPAGIHCSPGGNGDCRYTFTTNEPITLIPTAFSGSRFQNWGGHPDCEDGTVSAGGDKEKFCGVYFVKLPEVTESTDSEISQPIDLNATDNEIEQPIDSTAINNTDTEITTTTDTQIDQNTLETVQPPPLEYIILPIENPIYNETVQISEPIIAVAPAVDNVTSKPVILLPQPNFEDCLPTTHPLNTVCNAKGKSITHLEIGEYGNLSNGVIEGILLNQGWVSNLTLKPQSQLIGGVVTGSIINGGQMADFEFRGALISGGTLAGTIVINSRIGGVLADVNFAAHAHLIGGKLAGHISGDPQAPALLEDVEIQANTYLSGVVLGSGTTVGTN